MQEENVRPIMRRINSPMPIGRTSGHLSKAINLHALQEVSKYRRSVTIRMARFATVLRRSLDDFPNAKSK